MCIYQVPAGLNRLVDRLLKNILHIHTRTLLICGSQPTKKLNKNIFFAKLQ